MICNLSSASFVYKYRRHFVISLSRSHSLGTERERERLPPPTDVREWWNINSEFSAHSGAAFSILRIVISLYCVFISSDAWMSCARSRTLPPPPPPRHHHHDDGMPRPRPRIYMQKMKMKAKKRNTSKRKAYDVCDFNPFPMKANQNEAEALGEKNGNEANGRENNFRAFVNDASFCCLPRHQCENKRKKYGKNIFFRYVWSRSRDDIMLERTNCFLMRILVLVTYLIADSNT